MENLKTFPLLVNAWQNVWYASVHRVVWCAPSHCQQSIAAEDALGEDTRESVACEAFLAKLALYAVNGVAQESATSLDVPGVLLLASWVELGSSACKVLVRLVGECDS